MIYFVTASNPDVKQLVPTLKYPPGAGDEVSNSVAKLTITPKKEPVRGFDMTPKTTPKTSPVKVVKSVNNGLKRENAVSSAADVTSSVSVSVSDSGAIPSSEVNASSTSVTSATASDSNSVVESSPFPAKDPNFRPPLPKSSSK